MRPKLHPACAAWPPLPDQDLKALAADIKANGLNHAIVLTTDGLLLSGRERWDACAIAGVKPRTVTYSGNDADAFVLSENKHRRHLDRSQMAMVVAKFGKLSRGAQVHNKNSVKTKTNVQELHIRLNETRTRSTKELEKLSDVPRTYINYARFLRSNAEPQIIQWVEDGLVNINFAWEAVRKNDRAIQATWTLEDLKRVGSDVIQNCYDSNLPKAVRQQQDKPTKQQNPKKPVRHIPDPPYTGGPKFPTREESGYPPEGSSIADYRAFFEENGRTPLVSKSAKELAQDHIKVMALGAAVTSLARDDVPNADAFLDAIGRMLSHEPADKGVDYAVIARRILTTTEKHLPAALERLTRLADALRARKAGRARKAATTDEIHRLDTLLH
jgi:hypothetical protein